MNKKKVFVRREKWDQRSIQSLFVKKGVRKG